MHLILVVHLDDLTIMGFCSFHKYTWAKEQKKDSPTRHFKKTFCSGRNPIKKVCGKEKGRTGLFIHS